MAYKTKQKFNSVNVLFQRCIGKSSGQSLVQALVYIVVTAITATSFLRLTSNQARASRNIASNSATVDLSNAIDLLTNSANCGQLGVSAFSFAGNNPVGVTVGGLCTTGYCLALDTISFSTGVRAITTQNDPNLSSMLYPNRVSSITFTALGGNTANTFPFEMNVYFSNSQGLPASSLHKFISITTDSSNNVTGMCNGGVSVPASPPSSNGSSLAGYSTSLCTPMPTGLASCNYSFAIPNNAKSAFVLVPATTWSNGGDVRELTTSVFVDLVNKTSSGTLSAGVDGMCQITKGATSINSCAWTSLPYGATIYSFTLWNYATATPGASVTVSGSTLTVQAVGVFSAAFAMFYQ